MPRVNITEKQFKALRELIDEGMSKCESANTEYIDSIDSLYSEVRPFLDKCKLAIATDKLRKIK